MNNGVTDGRGYTLIDFPYLPLFGADWDAIICLMEHVRQNFHVIVPGVPAGSAAYLLSGGTAHNVGLLPLLGLCSPPHVVAGEPNFGDMIAAVGAWAGALSDEHLLAIVRETDAPTWAELQAAGTHPNGA